MSRRATARFLDRLGHDLVRNAAQLQVELETGDALLGAGDLAIHVAERVFPTDDVGQQFVIGDFILSSVFGADADADARHRASHRNACIHQRQGAAANRRHRSGTVRFHDFARDADRVGIRRRAAASARWNVPPKRRGRFRGGPGR